MSNPSCLDSKFISRNDFMRKFGVESVSSSNPFLSTQPVEDPPTSDTHHASICNFVDSCNSGTLAGHPGLSNPVLMATFCNSSRPNDGQSQGAVPADKRKHKMIERKRRKDMNALMSILRSLLPDESLRGKRAVSDQVQETVNYVHHLQRKVEDLSIERDKLKAKSDNNAKVSFQGVRLSSDDKFCIKALPIGGSDREFPTVKIKCMGSAYQVWTNTFEHQIVYSDLLMTLEDGGLEVVCAASSAINNRVYHTIHTKDGIEKGHYAHEEETTHFMVRLLQRLEYRKSIMRMKKDAFHGAAGSESLRFLFGHLEFQLGGCPFIFKRESHGITLDIKFERSWDHI